LTPRIPPHIQGALDTFLNNIHLHDKILGVDKFDVSLEKQRVVVESSTLNVVCSGLLEKRSLRSFENEWILICFHNPFQSLISFSLSKDEILTAIQKTGKTAKVVTD